MHVIGFIAAMKEELDAFLALFEDGQKTSESVMGREFQILIHNNMKIIATQSGIGKVNAAMTTTIIIMNYHPELILNVGVAGGFQTNQKVLDMVIATSFVYTDVDVTGFGCKPGQILGDPEQYLASKLLVQTIKNLYEEGKISANVHFGIIGSGDQFITKEYVPRIKQSFPDVLCVEMEGAAIGHVCNKLNTEILSIRSISDVPVLEEDNKTQFIETVQKASEQAANVCMLLLNRVCHD